MSDEAKIQVGVSGCLLGQEVRFDGGHKRDRYLTDKLSTWFEYVPVCPEVAAGLGSPRPSLRLIGDPAAPRVFEPSTETDRTEQLQDTARAQVNDLAPKGLHGFILKASSPTCGMERVRVYAESGPAARTGQGVFARALAERLPTLPLEEEGRLRDPRLRENFILRVFTHRRFHEEVLLRPSRSALMSFHAAHKMILLAHDEHRARTLGRRLATATDDELEALVEHYARELFIALAKPAPRRRHQNALHHMAGFISSHLSDDERRELDQVIRSYGEGDLPLAVPMALLQLFNLRDTEGYGASQRYGRPHPAALGLYNTI